MKHHFVIDGRRWRTTDPGIPEKLRVELVQELMRARRDVGAAKRGADPEAERLARSHVQNAKVALGERGPKWWEPQTDAQLRPRMESAARALLSHRGADKTICPSDIARIVGGDEWRKRMAGVRAAMIGLVEAGELTLRQKGVVVSPEGLRGPIRIGLKSSASSTKKPRASGSKGLAKRRR